ncbi:hypothetical protein SAMN02910343_00677 [Dialister histaminiformans]|uniref:DUF2313 domain-containing protein n=1 Tax=Allisonella histaminiformans TaxID=209880 RepID=A0A1G5VIX4_9FIRM|nr:putative phage tail protein [Allisonella histaminiformans]SDA45802.1 hypothetical protein SAMN02910343_00677 [Allisonella histaminiformans]
MKKLERDVHVERYFPDVLAPAKEMKAIAAGEDPEFHLLYEKAWKWFANTFIFHTDLEGVERWESMLSIIPDPDESLSDRRREILFRVNNRLPYTERTLKPIYDMLYGKDTVIPEVRENQYALVLNLTGDAIWEAGKVKTQARCIAPANLTILACRNLGDYPSEIYATGILRSYRCTRYEMTANAHISVDDTGMHIAGAVVHNFKNHVLAGEE